ncbi:MAG: hypothetical protein N2746_10630 [Deltaproteobacteria bacterium]|nr:hypothetical protein [Deltaproteobacteria bacterium]
MDIHTHIIPDVDDGPKNFEDSINIIRQLYQLGIDTIVATPHKRRSFFSFDDKKVIENFNELCGMIVERNLCVKLYLGAEYYFGTDLFEDINNNSPFVIGNSKYLLVEFKSLRFSSQDKENLFRIFTLGYKIIAAHIERNGFNSDSFEGIEYLKNNSVLLQCDLMSLSGLWGKEAKSFMEELIKRDFVDIISTDVHCRDFESKLLSEGFGILSSLAGGAPEKYMGLGIKKRLGLL